MDRQQRNDNISIDDLVIHKTKITQIQNWMLHKHEMWIQSVQGNKKDKAQNQQEWRSTFKPHINFKDAQKQNEINLESNVMVITGPPGCGKTTGIKTIAKYIGFTIQELDYGQQAVSWEEYLQLRGQGISYQSNQQAANEVNDRANYPQLNLTSNTTSSHKTQHPIVPKTAQQPVQKNVDQNNAAFQQYQGMDSIENGNSNYDTQFINNKKDPNNNDTIGGKRKKETATQLPDYKSKKRKGRSKGSMTSDYSDSIIILSSDDNNCNNNSKHHNHQRNVDKKIKNQVGDAVVKQKLLLVDGLPIMATYQQFQSIYQSLSRLVQQTTFPLVFVITQTQKIEQDKRQQYTRQVLDLLQNKIQSYQVTLNPVATMQVVKALQQLLQKEGVSIDKQTLKSIAESFEGDLTQAKTHIQAFLLTKRINDLNLKQKNSNKDKSAKKNTKQQQLAEIQNLHQQFKDSHYSIYHAVGKILYNKRILNSQQITDSQFDLSSQPNNNSIISSQKNHGNDTQLEQESFKRQANNKLQIGRQKVTLLQPVTFECKDELQRSLSQYDPESIVAKAECSGDQLRDYLLQNYLTLNSQYFDSGDMNGITQSIDYLSDSQFMDGTFAYFNKDQDLYLESQDLSNAQQEINLNFKELLSLSVAVRGMMYSIIAPSQQNRSYKPIQSPVSASILFGSKDNQVNTYISLYNVLSQKQMGFNLCAYTQREYLLYIQPYAKVLFQDIANQIQSTLVNSKSEDQVFQSLKKKFITLRYLVNFYQTSWSQLTYDKIRQVNLKQDCDQHLQYLEEQIKQLPNLLGINDLDQQSWDDLMNQEMDRFESQQNTVSQSQGNANNQKVHSSQQSYKLGNNLIQKDKQLPQIKEDLELSDDSIESDYSD